MATGLWFTADGFSDVVFLLDVVVQFRTGYLEQGLMVSPTSVTNKSIIHRRNNLKDQKSMSVR